MSEVLGFVLGHRKRDEEWTIMEDPDLQGAFQGEQREYLTPCTHAQALTYMHTHPICIYTHTR